MSQGQGHLLHKRDDLSLNPWDSCEKLGILMFIRVTPTPKETDRRITRDC